MRCISPTNIFHLTKVHVKEVYIYIYNIYIYIIYIYIYIYYRPLKLRTVGNPESRFEFESSVHKRQVTQVADPKPRTHHTKCYKSQYSQIDVIYNISIVKK